MARVPQDVDLEDRLVYGLSPLRFGYLVIAVLCALSLWRVEAASPWVRAVPCLALVGAGAALAWARWRGRPVDRWLVDAAVFVRRNYRVGRGRARPRRSSGAVLVPLVAINALSAGDRSGAVPSSADVPPAA